MALLRPGSLPGRADGAGDRAPARRAVRSRRGQAFVEDFAVEVLQCAGQFVASAARPGLASGSPLAVFVDLAAAILVAACGQAFVFAAAPSLLILLAAAPGLLFIAAAPGLLLAAGRLVLPGSPSDLIGFFFACAGLRTDDSRQIVAGFPAVVAILFACSTGLLLGAGVALASVGLLSPARRGLCACGLVALLVALLAFLLARSLVVSPPLVFFPSSLLFFLFPLAAPGLGIGLALRLIGGRVAGR